MDWYSPELRTDYVGLPDVQGRLGDLLDLTWPLPAWMDRARCRDSRPEVFFPERGDSVDAAKRICRECPVIDRCLTFALDVERGLTRSGRAGVWGGMSAGERAALDGSQAA